MIFGFLFLLLVVAILVVGVVTGLAWLRDINIAYVLLFLSVLFHSDGKGGLLISKAKVAATY
jgi:hypothetical protein